jgi:hypothetical protein
VLGGTFDFFGRDLGLKSDELVFSTSKNVITVGTQIISRIIIRG